jgi:hypothetical protein
LRIWVIPPLSVRRAVPLRANFPGLRAKSASFGIESDSRKMTQTNVSSYARAGALTRDALIAKAILRTKRSMRQAEVKSLAY